MFYCYICNAYPLYYDTLDFLLLGYYRVNDIAFDKQETFKNSFFSIVFRNFLYILSYAVLLNTASNDDNNNMLFLFHNA